MPINGPSTPHRIKMPSSHLEDSDEGNGNDEKEKKPIIIPMLNSEQQPLKKPGNRGRRKLNSNQTANQRPVQSLSIKPDHKLTDFFPVRRSVRKSKKAVLEEKQRDMENKVLCQVEEGLQVAGFANLRSHPPLAIKYT